MKRLSVVFLLLILNAAYSLDFIPQIKTFSQKEYQAGVENWSAVADSNGIMYFANSEGVLEFDGVHWNLIKTKSGFGVRSLVLGKNNLIYVAGDYDFGYLIEDKFGKKKYVSLSFHYKGNTDKIKNVWKVISDNKYIYYLASNLIFVFDYHHNLVKTVNEEIYLRSFYKVDEKIYAYSNKKGILLFDPFTLGFSEICKNKEILNQSVEYVGAHPAGGLRFHVFKKGFYRFHKNNLMLEKSSSGTFLGNEYPFCGKQNQNEILIGTTTNGIISLNKENLSEKWHLNKTLGLNDDKIFDLFIDRFHNLWICHENGLSYVSLNLPLRFIDKRLGVSGQGYSCLIYKDHYFLGTSNGLYTSSASQNNSVGFFNVFNAIKQPTYFLKEINGKLLIGCHLELFLYDGVKIKSLPYSRVNKKCVVCPWNDNLLFISTDKGIMVLSVKDNFKKIGYLLKDSQECKDLEVVDDLVWFIDPSNTLVSAKINKVSSQATVFKTYKDKHYYSLTKFKNQLVVGTNKGLFKLDNVGVGEFQKTGNVKDTLPVNLVYSENDKQLWVEMSLFEKGKQRYRVDLFDSKLNTDQGSSELNALVSESKIFSFGQLLDNVYKVIGTTDGFVVLNSNQFFKRINIDSYIRKIDFNLTNSKHSFDGLWKNIKVFKHPVFHDESISLEVDCASNIYNATEKIHFQYIVEGQDSNWSHWIDNHKFNIPINEHGVYKLKVKATADFHTYSKVSEVVFEVRKPWYSTYWWYSFEIIILLLIVAVSTYFNRTGKNVISKISAIIIVLIILTLFETASELVQDWIDAKGATVFTLKIAINILIALSINPIENWLKYHLIKKPITGNIFAK